MTAEEDSPPITISGEVCRELHAKAKETGLSVEDCIGKILLENEKMKEELMFEEERGDMDAARKLRELDHIPITKRFTRKQINRFRARLAIDDVTFGDMVRLYMELEREFEREKDGMKRKIDYIEHGEKLWGRFSSLDFKYLGYSSAGGEYANNRLGAADKKEFLEKIDKDIENLTNRILYFRLPDYTFTDAANLKEREREIKEKQEDTLILIPGKDYAKISTTAVRSYKRLEMDFRTFREVIQNAPDENFNEKVIFI